RLGLCCRSTFFALSITPGTIGSNMVREPFTSRISFAIETAAGVGCWAEAVPAVNRDPHRSNTAPANWARRRDIMRKLLLESLRNIRAARQRGCRLALRE